MPAETGTISFNPDEIEAKGRLQPGKILLIDTQEGKIYYDKEVKENLASGFPTQNGWLPTELNLILCAVDVRWKTL